MADEKNRDARRQKIDRHDCVHLDVNKDNVDDAVCFVGADRSKGEGYNELCKLYEVEIVC